MTAPGQRLETGHLPVLFGVVPFAAVESPALGVSLLKAALARRSIESEIKYFNLDLVRKIGLDQYHEIEHEGDHGAMGEAPPVGLMLGEWVFCELAFREHASPGMSYERWMAEVRDDADALLERALRVRDACDTLLEEWSEEVARRRPRVLGLTTTFQQTCACLALARRVKERPDPPIIVLGGANCEASMGLEMLRSFPWIDYVATGPSEVAFPDFVEQLLGGNDSPRARGIVGRGWMLTTPKPSSIEDLDELPIPDFGEYFAAIETLGLSASIRPRLPFEGSRGCWWGAKHHCTFCGLNGDELRFRSKSPERVVLELEHLATTHGVSRVDWVDNILDHTYPRTALKELAERELGLEMFCETKSNLRFQELETMRAAGVSRIQPGIESFSDPILALMRKGSTGLQNVQLLRWCVELGIQVEWNLLYGFPGEPSEEYGRMASWLPWIVHLEPPRFCTHIRLDRFSPYFSTPAELGLTAVRPAPAYSGIFPLGPDALAELAYFFEFDRIEGEGAESYARPMVEVCRGWSELHSTSSAVPPRLDAFIAGKVVLITDSRPCATRARHAVTGDAARVLLACDRIDRAARLARTLNLAPAAVEVALERLVEDRLMLTIGDGYIGLPVLRNRERFPTG